MTQSYVNFKDYDSLFKPQLMPIVGQQENYQIGFLEICEA